MSATGTDDRFLRAAFVEGNRSGVAKSNFLGNARIYPRAIALDTTLLCRNGKSLEKRFAAWFTGGTRSRCWHLRPGSNSTPIAYGPA